MQKHKSHRASECKCSQISEICKMERSLVVERETRIICRSVHHTASLINWKSNLRSRREIDARNSLKRRRRGSCCSSESEAMFFTRFLLFSSDCLTLERNLFSQVTNRHSFLFSLQSWKRKLIYSLQRSKKESLEGKLNEFDSLRSDRVNDSSPFSFLATLIFEIQLFDELEIRGDEMLR